MQWDGFYSKGYDAKKVYGVESGNLRVDRSMHSMANLKGVITRGSGTQIGIQRRGWLVYVESLIFLFSNKRNNANMGWLARRRRVTDIFLCPVISYRYRRTAASCPSIQNVRNRRRQSGPPWEMRAWMQIAEQQEQQARRYYIEPNEVPYVPTGSNN